METALRILLIDDDAVDRQMIQRLFTHNAMSAELVEAANWQEGAEKLQAATFDCVLLDYRVPECDGLEALHHIQEHVPEVPVIVVTGYSDEKLAVEFLKNGVSDFLYKDRINTETLTKAIRFKALFDEIHRVQRKQLEVAYGRKESCLMEPEIVQFVQGDMALLHELLGQFETDCTSLLQEIKHAIEDGDSQELARTSHAIKGVAANFGGQTMQYYATLLHKPKPNHDQDSLLNLFHCLEQAFSNECERVTTYVKQHAAP